LTPEALEGVVLVTGGTGALGSAVVAELADSGATVVSTWLFDQEIERLDPGLKERIELVQADLTSDDGAAAAVEAAASKGELKAVVNLVGGFAAGGRLHEEPVETLEKMITLNLMTTVRVSRAALPKLVESDGGALVCVGTKTALEPFSGGSAYAVSKMAVLGLVRALDVEYRDDDVRVNAVMPSVIDTPANRESQPDADPSKWVPPEEIARVIRFLCSSDSAPISGAWVPVYGKS